MGFVQSRKPLKLIHQFSSSIKDQQKPIGQEKFMLARCQALGGYISLKFRYNKPSLKYQQRTRQSEWKELGKVTARLLMEIQMTANKSWQLLWMESGPCFLFSFDVFHLVKDNPAFPIWFLQQSSMPQEFRNCRNGGSSHISEDCFFHGTLLTGREILWSRITRDICISRVSTQRDGRQERNIWMTVYGLSDDLLIRSQKIGSGKVGHWCRTSEEEDRGWLRVQNQCNGQRAPTTRLKLLLNKYKIPIEKGINLRAISHNCALNTAQVWKSNGMKKAFSGVTLFWHNVRKKTCKEQTKEASIFLLNVIYALRSNQGSSDLSDMQFCLQICWACTDETWKVKGAHDRKPKTFRDYLQKC